jgi:hypothetical protein
MALFVTPIVETKIFSFIFADVCYYVVDTAIIIVPLSTAIGFEVPSRFGY